MKAIGTRNLERGAVLVEAAVITLVLLILTFAIFEAGRLINIQHTLTNAAREGARLSVLPLQGGTDTLPSTGVVQARVQTFLNASGLNGASATVAVDQCFQGCLTAGKCGPCTPGSTVYSRVTVTVPYRILSISMFGLLQVNLQGQSMMRNETNFQ